MINAGNGCDCVEMVEGGSATKPKGKCGIHATGARQAIILFTRSASEPKCPMKGERYPSRGLKREDLPCRRCNHAGLVGWWHSQRGSAHRLAIELLKGITSLRLAVKRCDLMPILCHKSRPPWDPRRRLAASSVRQRLLVAFELALVEPW
jgi:hypothetical protein